MSTESSLHKIINTPEKADTFMKQLREITPVKKAFFAKYLPVEGETKEENMHKMKGAILRTEGTKLIPHKLFLCSRDIQIGNKIIIPDECKGDSGLYMSNEVVVTSISMEGKMFHYKAPTIIGGHVHSGVHINQNPYKVVGEISSFATYVKEGNEYDEDQIAFTIYEPYEPDHDLSYEEWLESPFYKNIQIIGPCGHFH